MVNIMMPQFPVLIPLKTRHSVTKAHNDKSRGAIYLETNGYVIRSLIAEDVNEQFLDWFNAPKMLSGLNLGDLHFTIERLKSFVSGFDNYRNYFLGIFDQNEIVGFYTVDVNLLHRLGNITTGIGNNAYAGKHTLLKTINVILDFFYANREVDKFTARILSKNYAMIYNFKNSTRFIFEAHLKKECLAPDGSRVDLLVFASHKD